MPSLPLRVGLPTLTVVFPSQVLAVGIDPMIK
jgi:hypothetical protein